MTECPNCETTKKQCEEYKQGWQRAQADYQNLQKETARQKSEWVSLMKGDILESFIPVYDNFKKAFRANYTNGVGDDTNQVFENWKKGIEYIMKQFGDVLKQNGIEETKTVGEIFDPRFHEIVGEEVSPPPGEVTPPADRLAGRKTAAQDEIIREVDGGYKIGEKVIKVAKVIVAK